MHIIAVNRLSLRPARLDTGIHMHTRQHDVPKAIRSFRQHPRRFRDWGYAAAIIQFVGACLFSVSTIISVPHVLPAEATTDYWTWDASFWTLQVCCADRQLSVRWVLMTLRMQ